MSCLGYFVQIQGAQGVLESGRAFAVLGQPFVFLEALVDDRFQQPAQKQLFGAWGRPQPNVGVPGQFHFPGVYDHQLGVLPGRPFDGDPHHVVFFGDVAVENDDAGGFFEVPDGIGGPGVAQRLLQAQSQFGLGVGGLIDVIGLHGCPGELLGEVVLFIGAVGRGQEGESLSGIFGQSRGYHVQRLIPSCLHQLAVAADQRSLKTAGVVHELEAKFSFEAGLALIRRGIYLRHGADQGTIAVVLEVHLTAHRTEWADRPFHLPGLVPFVVAFDQRAHWADIDAGAAEFAARLQKRSSKRSAHQRLSAALREGDGVVTAQLLTGVDTATADDAQVVVPVIEGVGNFQRDLPVLVTKRRLQVHTQITDRVFELASFVLGAGNTAVVNRDVTETNVGGAADINAVTSQAATWVLGDDHLHDRAAKVVYFR